MKKRIVSMMLAAMVALSVVGCGSKTLSNDYVTVKQYKGLEVAQVEKVEVTDEQVEQSVQANLNAAAEKEPIKDRAAGKGDIQDILMMWHLKGERRQDPIWSSEAEALSEQRAIMPDLKIRSSDTVQGKNSI